MCGVHAAEEGGGAGMSVCGFHDQVKYGANDNFCLSCGERWVPYIQTPFDAKQPIKKRVGRKKKIMDTHI